MGSLKEEFGHDTGRSELEAEGRALKKEGETELKIAKDKEWVEGAVNSISGAIKSTVGSLTGNTAQQTVGKAQQLKGKVQKSENS